MPKLTVNFDGGSRGNPGPAAIGVVVSDESGEVVASVGERIGRATNNVAEYRALLRGIKLADENGATEVEIIGDSQLIVRQVEGRYKVKHADMKALHGQVKAALGKFDDWSISEVRRAYNAEADRLVNEAFDGEGDGAGTSADAPAGTRNDAPAGGSAVTGSATARPIDPGVDIGHVHLKVADIERALDFYVGVLGFEVTTRYGPEAAFISAGGYHHHIGLNTWQSRGGSPPAPGTTGLFHLAIRYPTRAALADALRRLVEARVPLEGASDHGVSEALYLSDPDGNGVELYWDRPREDWPKPEREGETVGMYTRPLDLDALIVVGVEEGEA